MKRRLALAGLAAAAPALAHGGEAHDLGWTLSACVTGPLALLALLYTVGWSRLWRRSQGGRAGLRRNAWLFSLGWASLAGALVSPLHEAGEVSFSMHMIEHEIIMLVSALLLVAARPGPALLWSLPARLRPALAAPGRWRLWHFLSDPLVATAIQGIVIVAWHAPDLFDRTLDSEAWHIAQHLSFVASALLFWWAMLHGRGGPILSASCLFLTSMIGGGLGALMALSASPWYAGYAAMDMTPSGLTPEQDQQLAGLIMWVPGGLWHLAAAVWFLARALNGMQARRA